MTTVPIKGVVSSDDDAEVYQFFGYSTVTPSTVTNGSSDVKVCFKVLMAVWTSSGIVKPTPFPLASRNWTH